jgi:hypothetical protein
MKSLGRAAILCIFLACAALPAYGSDLSAQLDEVQKLVQEKDYITALEDLKFIAQQIQEFRLAEVSPLFPSPPSGWRADPPVRTSREGELWSRRLQAQRRYSPEDGTARIDLVYDFNSPLIARVTLSLNPVYLAADPQAEAVEFAGEPGRLWFNPDTGEGELVIVVSGRVLVSMMGRGISGRDVLREFARRVDLVALSAFMPP